MPPGDDDEAPLYSSYTRIGDMGVDMDMGNVTTESVKESHKNDNSGFT